MRLSSASSRNTTAIASGLSHGPTSSLAGRQHPDRRKKVRAKSTENHCSLPRQTASWIAPSPGCERRHPSSDRVQAQLTTDSAACRIGSPGLTFSPSGKISSVSSNLVVSPCGGLTRFAPWPWGGEAGRGFQPFSFRQRSSPGDRVAERAADDTTRCMRRVCDRQAKGSSAMPASDMVISSLSARFAARAKRSIWAAASARLAPALSRS